MKNHKIKGVYKIESEKKQCSIIFSIANTNDPLKYDYFMLIINRKGNVIVKEINSPILLARENKFSIQRIPETSVQYQEYVDKITDYQIQPIKYTLKENEYGLRLRRKESIKSRA